jgi:serine-type D-Ala-D-Ala carboxypeptidase/endopeptidase
LDNFWGLAMIFINMQKMIITARIIYCAMLLFAFPSRSGAENITNALQAFLQQRVEVEKRDAAIVVGLVDERGSYIVSNGKLDNGVHRDVDGDTLFEVGSITKTFTALLLQDMIERGDMKLDDPVAMYLPASVRMPSRNGKPITLLELVIHTSGLPENPDNLGPTWANYTTEELYTFLSRCKLTNDPGTRYEYSNLGALLLGHVIELRAGTNYESLLVDRVCRPLGMNSTRCILTSELKVRATPGHDPSGKAFWNEVRSPVFYPQGGLWTTANDLIKYASAYLCLTQTGLAPLFKKAREVHAQPGIPAQNLGSWVVQTDPLGRRFSFHAGDTAGYSAFVGFDEAKKRGVVILCSTSDPVDVDGLFALLIESEWHPDKRPREAKIGNHIYDSFVGQYQCSPQSASVIGIDIRRVGDRLFAQTTGSRPLGIRILLPPIEGELVPESETSLFGRLSGMPITFSRNSQNEVLGLTVQFGAKASYYKKISDRSSSPPEQSQ